MADEPVQDTHEADITKIRASHFVKILSSHMPETLEKDAVDIALVAVDKFKHLKDIAFHIKHEYDRKYPGTGKATEGVYHCIVGKSFASAVSHETRQFIHLRVDSYNIIVWKSKDSPFHVNDL